MCGFVFKSETDLWVEGASSSSVYILAVPLVYCSCDNRPPNRRPTMSAGFAPGEHTAAELLEDELRNEMSQISIKAEEGTELLTNLQTALQNIRVAGKKDGWGQYNKRSVKRGTPPARSSAPSSPIKTKQEMVEQLRIEKNLLENERNALLQHEAILAEKKKAVAVASPPPSASMGTVLETAASPKKLQAILSKAQQSAVVADALIKSNQQVLSDLKLETDNMSNSVGEGSPEKIKIYNDSVDKIEQEHMHRWAETRHTVSANEAINEDISRLQKRHAKVLEENILLKNNVEEFAKLRRKHVWLQEQYKARREAMLQVQKRQDDAWRFALRALEDKAALQATAHSETIAQLTIQLETAQEIARDFEKSEEGGADGGNSLQTFRSRCVELESYLYQVRKENVEIKRMNLSLKEKLLSATELGQDAVRHAEVKNMELQQTEETEEKKLRWLEQGNKTLQIKLDQLTKQNDLLKAELYEKNKTIAALGKSNDWAKEREKLEQKVRDCQSEMHALHSKAVEEEELKERYLDEKLQAFQRLEDANRISEEYKQLVIQMQTASSNGEEKVGQRALPDQNPSEQFLQGPGEETEPAPESKSADQTIRDVRNVFNTAVDMQLAANLGEVFCALDKSNDGTLSMQELKDGLAKMKFTLQDEEVRQLWDSLDVDHDDKISYSEFEQFCVQKQRRRSIMSMAAKSATKRRLYKQTVKTIVSEAATLGHLKTSRRRAATETAQYAARVMERKRVRKCAVLDAVKTADLKRRRRSVASDAAAVGTTKSRKRRVAAETASLAAATTTRKNLRSIAVAEAVKIGARKSLIRSAAVETARKVRHIVNSKNYKLPVSPRKRLQMEAKEALKSDEASMFLNERIDQDEPVPAETEKSVELEKAENYKAVIAETEQSIMALRKTKAEHQAEINESKTRIRVLKQENKRLGAEPAVLPSRKGRASVKNLTKKRAGPASKTKMGTSTTVVRQKKAARGGGKPVIKKNTGLRHPTVTAGKKVSEKRNKVHSAYNGHQRQATRATAVAAKKAESGKGASEKRSMRTISAPRRQVKQKKKIVQSDISVKKAYKTTLPKATKTTVTLKKSKAVVKRNPIKKKKADPEENAADIEPMPLEKLLSSPRRKPVVLKRFAREPPTGSKWLDKGMSPASRKPMKYKPYTGPISPSAKVNTKRAKGEGQNAEEGDPVVKTLEFKKDSKTVVVKRPKRITTGFSKEKKYKPILRSKTKIESTAVVKARTKAVGMGQRIVKKTKKATPMKKAKHVHNPANAARSPPPPTIPPPLFFPQEDYKNELNDLEQDISDLLKNRTKQNKRTSRTAKIAKTDEQFSKLKKDWSHIKLGYAPKYSAGSGLKKAKRVDNRLAKIRKKQAALDASIASTFGGSTGKDSASFLLEPTESAAIVVGDGHREEGDTVTELVPSFQNRKGGAKRRSTKIVNGRGSIYIPGAEEGEDWEDATPFQ